MKVSYLTGMEVSASGLAAQRAVMNAAAENLANAQTTRTEKGEPYRRKIATLAEQPVSFAERMVGAAQAASAGGASAGTAGATAGSAATGGSKGAQITRTDPAHLSASAAPAPLQTGTATGVKADITEDPSAFPEIYDPGHPDADENGMVRMPNVDTA